MTKKKKYKYYELVRDEMIYENCSDFEEAKYNAEQYVYAMGDEVQIFEVNTLTGKKKLVFVLLEDDFKGIVTPIVPHKYVKIWEPEEDEVDNDTEVDQVFLDFIRKLSGDLTIDVADEENMVAKRYDDEE